MVCDKHFFVYERYNFFIFQPNSNRFAPNWGTDFSRFDAILKIFALFRLKTL